MRFRRPILWGLGYTLSEKIMRDSAITPAVLMLLIQLIIVPMYILLCLYLGQLKTGFSAAFSSPQILGLLVVAAVTVLGGNFLILNSIVDKNATLTGVIEISYPLFTAFFSYLILKDVQLDWWTALGGVLIFGGVIVIAIKS